MNARFRLAQLSDLHFNANPKRVFSGLHALLSWHDAAAVREATAQLQGLPPGDIDVLIMSGDLATSGDVADLQLARDFVSDIEALDSVSKVVVIPGNHDRYSASNLSFYTPGGSGFERYFPDHIAFDATLLADIRRDGCRLVVVGLDLCLNPSDASVQFGLLDHPGCGGSYDTVLEHASIITNDVRSDGEPIPYVVWVCHFPPGARHSLRLIDEQRFLQEASLAAPNLVLFGHTHVASFANMGMHSITGLVGAATTVENNDPIRNQSRAFSVLDVDADPTGKGRVYPSHYHWNHARATFC